MTSYVIQDDLSKALRARSIPVVERAFARLVKLESKAGDVDDRDTMVNLAPFIDCVRRLGHDPLTVLGPIAGTGAPWFALLFDGFVRRTDITLAAFGWTLVVTPDGPRYATTA